MIQPRPRTFAHRSPSVVCPARADKYWAALGYPGSSKCGRWRRECFRAKSTSVRVYAVKGSWQLDQSIQSKIVAMAFSMAAEIERDLISQRTREALRYRKEQGMRLGRPPGPGKSKLDQFRPEIEALLANGSTQRFVARRYNTTEANLHNWIKRHGLNQLRRLTKS